MFKMDLKIRNINIDVPVLSNLETTTINCKVEGKYLLQYIDISLLETVFTYINTKTDSLFSENQNSFVLSK